MHYNMFKRTRVSAKLFNTFIVFSIFFVSSMLFLKTTAYAAVPYTYKINTATTISGTTTTTTNILDITFDYGISINDLAGITIYQTSGTASMKTPQIGNATVSNGNELLIPIEALDPTVISYAVKINKSALTFSGYTALTDFIIPFSSTDCANGFQSEFMTTNAENNLNTNIFAYNSPSGINILVPKTYVTSIQTIHKASGLIIPPTTPTTVPTITYPKLTNISIKTDPAVVRLKVSITPTTGPKLTNMELFSTSSTVGFTAGQAGLNIDTGGSYGIEVMAYDINGKLLQDFTHTETVQTLETVSDYVPKTSTSAGKAITLYDLMKTQATLTTMLNNFSGNLDSIKVVYPNTADTRLITNTQGQSNDAANMLAKALSDSGVQYIKFASALNITPTQDVTLARPSLSGKNVVLDGTGSTINGNVVIGGTGDTNIYDLRNLTIKGNLTINVTGAGDCTLTNVTVTGTKTINKVKACTVTGVVSMDDITSHKIGETIKIGVKFSEPVYVVGNPILDLSINNNINNTIIGKATYDKTGTNAITTNDEVVFDYIVQPGDSSLNLNSVGIETFNSTNDIIQSTGGIIKPDISGSGTILKPVPVYSSISNKQLVVYGIRPACTILSVTTPSNVIECTANEMLDKTSTQTVANWLIEYEVGGIYVYSQPQQVVLQADNTTVMIIMANGVSISPSTVKQIFMGNVMDIGQNTANNMPAAAPTGIAVNVGEGTISGTVGGEEYSLDGGTTWTAIIAGPTSITIPVAGATGIQVRTAGAGSVIASLPTSPVVVAAQVSAPTVTSFTAATGIVAGLTASATNLEASVSTDGTTFASYLPITVDASGNVTITGTFTTSSKIRIRVAGTTTTLSGAVQTLAAQ